MVNPFDPKNYRSYKEEEKEEKKEENIEEVDVDSLDLSQLNENDDIDDDLKVKIKPIHLVISGVVFLICFYFLERIGAFFTQVGGPYTVEIPAGIGLFKYMITTNFAMFMLFLVLSLAIAAIVLSRLIKPKEKEEDRMKIAKISVMGSTNWMDNKEMNERFNICPVDRLDGIPIGVRDGKAICIPWDADLPNSNILISGPPGTRKSRGHIVPDCIEYMRQGRSIFVTDTKGVLYSQLTPIAEHYGYKVKKFVCQGERFRYSDGWDCLKNIRESSDPLSAASIFADSVITNTEDPKGNSPLFWRNLDGNLLEALVLYVAKSPHFVPLTERKEPKRDIKEVYALLSSNFEMVEQIFENIKIIDNKDLCLAAYERWHTNAQAEQGFSNLATRLRIFQNDFITGMLSSDDIDIKDAGREKCIYFIIMDDQVSTYGFISSLFFTFAFYELVKLADETDQSLPVPVQFVLDEFANCGVIPDFTKKISTVRSRGIGITICIQGLNQLKLLYPNGEWENIINGCAVQILLGAYENTTAKYYSDMIGDCTVEVENQARDFATFSLSRVLGYARDVKITKTSQRRRLLTPEEIRGMAVNRQIVLIAGTTKVLEENKYDMSMHPDTRITADIKYTEGTPHWVIDDGLDEVAERSDIGTPPNVDKRPEEAFPTQTSGLGNILSQAKQDRKEELDFGEFDISGLNNFDHDDKVETISDDDVNESINDYYLFDELTDDEDESGLL